MFRQFLDRLSAGIRNFMAGRYGPDKLGYTLLVTAVVLSVIGTVLPPSLLKLLMSFLYYFLMCWALFRMFSRNTYARYEENRKFLRFFDHLKDREHRYFECPKCRQTVRVPRGKGKIAITCPRCREKFIKKT